MGEAWKAWLRGLVHILPRHMRGHPLAPLYVLIFSLAVGSLALSLRDRIVNGPAIAPGFHFDRQAYVTTVYAARSDVHPGDRVVAFNGQPVTSGVQLYRQLGAAGVGASVELELLETSGARRTLRGRNMDLPRGSWFLGGTFWLLLALAVAWVRPENGAPLHLFLAGVGGGCSFLHWGLLPSEAAASPLALFWNDGIFGWLFPAYPALLAEVPYRPPFARPWMFVAIYTVALAIGTVHGVLVARGGPPAATMQAVWGAGLVLMLLGTVVILVWRARQPMPPRAAAIQRLLLFNFVFVVPACAVTFAEFSFGQPLPIWMGDVARLFPLGPVVVVGLAVVRAETISPDEALIKATAYGGALVGLASALILVAAGLIAVGPAGMTQQPAFVAAAFCSAAVAYWPLSRWLRRRVGRSLRDRKLTFRAKIGAIDELLQMVAMQPLVRIAPHVERVLQVVLNADEVRLTLGDGGGGVAPEPGAPPLTASAADGPRLLSCAIGTTSSPARLSVRLSGQDSESLRLLNSFTQGAAIALGLQGEQRQLGDYRLLSFAGKGGMSVVFIGKDMSLTGSGVRVAIKQVLPRHLQSHVAEEVRHRFIVEGRHGLLLKHDNIVQVREVGDSPSGPYIAFEFVDGCDARHLLNCMHAGRERIDVASAVLVGRSVAAALAYAHASDPASGRPGLIHGDVSPDNVLLSIDGVAKLSDFGVALVLDTQRDGERTWTKADYAAPEVIESRQFSAAADIYSLGVMLYELLLGEHPYRARTVLETKAAALKRRWMPIDAMRPDVGAGVAAVITRAMQKEPHQRFTNAGELAAALEQAHPAGAAAQAALAALVARHAGTARGRVLESAKLLEADSSPVNTSAPTVLQP